MRNIRKKVEIVPWVVSGKRHVEPVRLSRRSFLGHKTDDDGYMIILAPSTPTEYDSRPLTRVRAERSVPHCR
jgi:hypothetical protein